MSIPVHDYAPVRMRPPRHRLTRALRWLLARPTLLWIPSGLFALAAAYHYAAHDLDHTTIALALVTVLLALAALKES